MPDPRPDLLASLPLAPLLPELRAMDEAALCRFVDGLLARAAEVEPAVRSLLFENGRADRLHREVATICERWPDPSQRPALFGVPVGVKDIVAVDGLPTRAGSALPAEAFEMPEATVVRLLREAGALVFGKTVTAEFASMSPGGTANPHNTAHTPGGSSSGSAAGVAAGIFPLALGTQTGGSVIRPAAFCGVFGLKPSYGRIPIEGVLPHAISVDTLGYFTQDVAGIVFAAPALVEGWRDSPAREAAGITLAIPEGPYLELATLEGQAAFEEAVAVLTEAGVSVVRAPFLDDIDEVLKRHSLLMEAEFSAEHTARFARWGALYSGGAAEKVDSGARIPPDPLARALDGRAELRGRLASYLDEVGADALIAPSALGPAPLGLRTTGDPKMNAPWTHAGVPAITAPAGSVEGLPVGLQFIGRFGADEELVAVATALAPLVGR